ncbi:MAG: excinuclease ABC subunit UvrA [Bacteroidetes bacterium]|nr:excinuclease ABC subunit UvrA [Bacteroidota bacterium]
MKEKAAPEKNPKDFILIKGAKQHNLKNIELAIPRNRFVVITGVSGSGKSSLAFDTLYAEGQRRYVESLSAYARQFLGRLEKPQVEYIKGISPAIAIEQKVISKNPRSTVGTVTEIYDYLKLLFARIGKTYSPISGKEVKKHRVTDVVDFILHQKENKSFLILSKLHIPNGRETKAHLEILHQQGFSRVLIENEIKKIEELPESITSNTSIFLVIDRIIPETFLDKEELAQRIADSAQVAFYEGHGTCLVHDTNTQKQHVFSNRFEADGMEFSQPDVNFFSYNNPVGACKKCEGFGSVIGIDPALVIPNKSKSVYDNAIACWNGDSMSAYKKKLIQKAHLFQFPVHKPISDLSKEQYELLWTGNEHFEGIHSFFERIEKEAYKIQYRVLLSRYKGKTICPDCKGTRIRKDAQYVRVADAHISQLLLTPIEDLLLFFKGIRLNEQDKKIAQRLLIEITNRLQYICDVGLGYLTLNRGANTLSGGESQRINLATSLGSTLVGSLYILDEPSIGLHPRDTERLIQVLKMLQQQGNTLIVVEHDEEIMQAAHWLIDMGPFAGSLGGEVVFEGNHAALLKEENSLTTQYLTGKKQIEIPKTRRRWKYFLEIKEAGLHNLKNIDVKIPLEIFCVVTGVSGSGKSTLVKNILVPALQHRFENYGVSIDKTIIGNLEKISGIEFVDQNPIGKSSRSNPATYIKAYDEIRTLFAEQPLSKQRGYQPFYFSYNVEGGRCEHCQGEGEITVEMQFMADVKLLCEDCGGKRFNAETLEITFYEKNIADILNMTVDDAVVFFTDKNNKTADKIVARLKLLQDVGLGYVQLGQSSSTLSGGEAQRVKLASFLGAGQSNKNILFVFDEPTTGLHFNDIEKLLKSLQLLINKGNSVLVIEHNLDVIKCADWIIDMGPEGGEKGGTLVFEGPPEEMIKNKKSYTGAYLSKKMKWA